MKAPFIRGRSTRAWSRSRFPRPYIWRLTSFSLQSWLSVCPLDQGDCRLNRCLVFGDPVGERGDEAAAGSADPSVQFSERFPANDALKLQDDLSRFHENGDAVLDRRDGDCLGPLTVALGRRSGDAQRCERMGRGPTRLGLPGQPFSAPRSIRSRREGSLGIRAAEAPASGPLHYSARLPIARRAREGRDQGNFAGHERHPGADPEESFGSARGCTRGAARSP